MPRYTQPVPAPPAKEAASPPGRKPQHAAPRRGPAWHAIQLKAAQSAASAPRAASGSGLPVQLKAGIERLSGIAMDDVRVHRNSPEPAKLGALAYAQGSDIHLGPGQERHLPHEAWHVVQQKQGRVRPTAQFKGVTLNEDASLEREADDASEKVDRQNAIPSSPLKFVRISRQILQRQAPTFGNLPRDAPAHAGSRRVSLTSEGGKWKEVNFGRTAPVRTAKGSYDFVVLEDGRIFAVRASSKFGHTEAAAGERVVWAGQISFTQSGELKVWNNASGHYLPQGGFAENATLRNPGLDIKKYRTAYSGPGPGRRGPQLPVFQPDTKSPAARTSEPAEPPTRSPAPSQEGALETTSQLDASIGRSVVQSSIKPVLVEIGVNVLLFAVAYLINKWNAEKQAQKFKSDLKKLLADINNRVQSKNTEIVEKQKLFQLVYSNIKIKYTRDKTNTDDYNEGSMRIVDLAISHQNYQEPERQKKLEDFTKEYADDPTYYMTFSVPLFDEVVAEKVGSSNIADYRDYRETINHSDRKTRLSGAIHLYMLAKEDASLTTLVVRDLLGMLKDQDELVRLAAANYLYSLHAKIAAQYLRETLPITSDVKQKGMIEHYLRDL